MRTPLVSPELRTTLNLPKRALLLPLAGLLAVAGLLGCAQKNESQEDESEEGHPLVGEVLEVDPERSEIKVAHEDIPGFMPAMTMDFRVGPGDIELVEPGLRVRGRLIRDDDGGFRLIKIWPLDDAAAAAMETYNRRLQAQAEKLGSGRYVAEGDALLDFALMDQFGRAVTPETLKGKPFVLNFVFTRCPDATMCPASTAKMAQLQREAKARGLDDLQFVSVTLDPKFDTPGVLRAYAEAYGIDGSNFRFVTGPADSVRTLVRALGVTAIEQDETIVHSLATVLVDRDRQIALRVAGSDWKTEPFLEAAAKL